MSAALSGHRPSDIGVYRRRDDEAAEQSGLSVGHRLVDERYRVRLVFRQAAVEDYPDDVVAMS